VTDVCWKHFFRRNIAKSQSIQTKYYDKYENLDVRLYLTYLTWFVYFTVIP